MNVPHRSICRILSFLNDDLYRRCMVGKLTPEEERVFRDIDIVEGWLASAREDSEVDLDLEWPTR